MISKIRGFYMPGQNFMRSAAPRNQADAFHMKFSRILSGCPEGAKKWRILTFAMLLYREISPAVEGEKETGMALARHAG